MRRKVRQENGSICGKNIHKNQEEKRSQKQIYLEHQKKMQAILIENSAHEVFFLIIIYIIS